jgi:hypothetical protein
MKNSTYSNTFDNTTMYDVGERININLVNDNFRSKLRPKTISYYKPIPKPFKDQSFFQPARQEVRTENKYKDIPHKDYYSIQPYSNPYYNIKETGYSNINHKDIFKKYY